MGARSVPGIYLAGENAVKGDISLLGMFLNQFPVLPSVRCHGSRAGGPTVFLLSIYPRDKMILTTCHVVKAFLWVPSNANMLPKLPGVASSDQVLPAVTICDQLLLYDRID